MNSNREPMSKSSDSSHNNNNNSASTSSSSSSSHHPSSKDAPKNSQKSDNQAKKAPTSARQAASVVDIPVTPLLSYSKVATGTISLNEIQKQLQSHMKVRNSFLNILWGLEKLSLNSQAWKLVFFVTNQIWFCRLIRNFGASNNLVSLFFSLIR